MGHRPTIGGKWCASERGAFIVPVFSFPLPPNYFHIALKRVMKADKKKKNGADQK